MKQQQSIVLSAMIAVAVGIAGSSLYVDAASQPELGSMEQLALTSGIYGHLEVVHTTADGNIVAYRQLDNVITTEGVECAVELLLAGAAIGSNTCPTSSPDAFNFVELTNGGTAPDSADNAASRNATYISTSIVGLERSDGICTYTDGAGSGSAICSVTFTKTNAGSQVVDGAYLIDNATPTAVFAGNNFTSVTLNQSDDLDITWTITLS